jgi:tol-pal system protein YbgF
MKFIGYGGLILLVFFSYVSLAAEIPIEDLSDNGIQLNQNAPTRSSAQPVIDQSLTMDQRVAKLEQQMSNFTQIDLMGKIDNLQEQIQQLRGELEVQKHELKLMHDQLNNFYQDLDKRVSNKSNFSTLVTAATETKDKSGLDGIPLTSSKAVSEEQAYQDGLKFIKDKKYSEAISKMQAYLRDYSSGKYSANAHYWLGEIYYMQLQSQKAANEFQTIINIYPNSSKIPDAMLKMGMIYNDRGEYSKAYKQFQQLKKQYPESKAAQLVDHQPLVKGNKS